MVVADLAGTTVDSKCRGALSMLKKSLATFGYHFPENVIAEDMGKPKLTHIRNLLLRTHLNKQKYGHQKHHAQYPANINHVAKYIHEHMLKDIAPKVLYEHSKPIPGVHDAFRIFREKGVFAITSTTGYPEECAHHVLKRCDVEGLFFDTVCCSNQVAQPRPGADGIYEILRRLRLTRDNAAVIKIGDTTSDLLEGKNANAWRIYAVTEHAADGSAIDCQYAHAVCKTILDVAKDL